MAKSGYPKEAGKVSETELAVSEISVRFIVNERFNRKVPYHPEMKVIALFSFLERYLKSEGLYAWRGGQLGLEPEPPWKIFGGHVLLPNGEACNFFGKTTTKTSALETEKYLVDRVQTVSSLGLTHGCEIAIGPRDMMDFFFPFEDEYEDEPQGHRLD